MRDKYKQEKNQSAFTEFLTPFTRSGLRLNELRYIHVTALTIQVAHTADN